MTSQKEEALGKENERKLVSNKLLLESLRKFKKLKIFRWGVMFKEEDITH